MNNNMFSKAAVWLVIALVLFTVFKQFDKPRVQEGVSYSQFMDDAKNGKVKNVVVQGRNLTVTPADGQKYQIVSPGDIWMVGDLMKYGVQVSGKADDEPNALMSALYYLGPTILIIVFWFYMMRQMQGGGKGGAFSFGKSRARLIDENNNAVNFSDVAGCDEAKEEVSELVDFLRDPQKFQKLAAAFRAACCSSARRVPARRCSHGRSPAKRRCRSSAFRAPTSSKCSSASALLACVTCSSRRRSTRLASCSSTKSTRSAVIAAPAWAAATTSASRR